jgi:hypothetical protein
MALSPVAVPPHKTLRAVQFAMLDGTALVPIVVSHAAIEAIEPVPNWSGDHLIDFAKYRSIFEQIASDKHARGQIEDDGSIVIQAGDR